jgi:D-sedoheptulose 7-phosphate isomerase
MTATDYMADLGACLTTTIATQATAVVSLNDAMDDACLQIQHARGVVHVVGNGGSASIVAHVQNDLVKACGVRALVYQDVPLLTAYANDNGYQNGYADALSVWLGEHDVLIAVSSSGASLNITNAAARAKQAGALVITCTGFLPDNPLRQLGHLNFYVPSSNYGHVELTHAALLHCLTDRLAHAR